ncbi:MAG TPA: AMP-binding protein [Actinophytocola sp.]|uniref:AMP-binding protein n=1 Tax=Actinophytocola sp. TaxID=1872138 RepID=UPI002DBA03E8|nr:AMP-binding protein [Actinophytocola sp.]HEU5473560.1 AMP-binding protein [Actinophytocola sp.]
MATHDSLLTRLARLPGDVQVTRERTAGQLVAEVEELSAGLAVGPGEPVGFRLPNSEQWVVGFLGLLHAGATPLLIAPDAPRKEVDRLLGEAGAGRELILDGGFRLAGEPGPTGDRGVLLTTSGSTGLPKLVLRDEESLLAEGLRYQEAAGLDGADRLVLPLPLTHAYALGWLAGALVSGTQVVPLAPTALSAVAAELADGATILALVPTTARLLTLRGKRKPIEAPKLRLAMVGAGPVDDRLEEDFRSALGISTGRNYGSTETGALFCGLSDLPPRCVGHPMPGVRYRITGEAPGQLEVAIGTGSWQPTGDLADADEHGRVRVLGRRHGAVRRGGRWVAPAEVESVLREHPQVRDARVRAGRGRFADEESLVAEVVPDGALDETDLLDFARDRLSGHKVPDQVRVRQELERTATGKPAHGARHYRLAAAPDVAAAMRAYRRSELLFALGSLGALDRLAGGADVDELTDELDLPAESLRWVLDIATDLGITVEGEGEPDEPVAGFGELLGLERELAGGWLSARAIADAVRTGIPDRPFETAELDPGLLARYGAAMHGPHTAARTRLGLRLLGRHARGRVLEVTAGPGRYLAALRERRPDLTGCHLLQVGRLAGAPLSELDGAVPVGSDAPAGVFDACVVSNAVHGPGPTADPAWLLDRLAPGGVLLVDDLFLPADGGPGAELGLDWLTHGGTAWPRLDGWLAGLAAVGGSVVRTVRLTPPECCLILATEEH